MFFVLSRHNLCTKRNTRDTATIYKHTMPKKRHADSTQDENPRKRRQLSADEVLLEAARNGDTTAVRAVLEKFNPDRKKVTLDAAYEACRGNHDECLTLLLPYVETTQMGFGMLLSECVHADHVACTEVLLQHWKCVCNNVAFVRLESKHSAGEEDDCPAMWADPAVCRVLIDAGADIEIKNGNGRSPLHTTSCFGKLGTVKMLVRAGAGVRVADNDGDTCLMLAAYFGHTETVRYLVGLPDVEVNYAANDDSFIALHCAVQEGHADVVEVLIDAGADIDAKTSDACTPFHYACEDGKLTILKMLLKAGANVCATYNDGDTCLKAASGNGHTETVRYLVGLKEVDVNHTADGGETALHHAVIRNNESHPEVVQVLIDAGADIEIKNGNGRSPLHTASRFGKLGTVKMLVRAGAGVRVADNDGDTCLTLAAYFGHTETVRYLVGLPDVEVNHEENDSFTALHFAVQEGRRDVVEVLIDAGADIDARTSEGCAPLHYACGGGKLAIVKVLVKAGADVCATYNEGATTCVMSAVHDRHTETVRYLVGLPNVDVNAANNHSCILLHAAVTRCNESHPDIVEVLIDAGADIEAKNGCGRSPLLLACELGKLNAVKMLVEAGARVCATDDQVATCLILAAYFGHTETVRYLVGLPDVDVNLTANGETALHYASRKKHTDVVHVLLEHGAVCSTDCAGHS